MANGLCMNCFQVKGRSAICPHCGYAEGTPAKELYHLQPGTLLKDGRYIVGVSIGIGGFSIIYRAYDRVLGIITAVKEYYPAGLVNRSPATAQIGLVSGTQQAEFVKSKNDFLMEARLLKRLQKSEHIVKIYDCFEENGTVYIVMEDLDGPLLKDVIRQHGKLEPKKAAAMVLHIIEAVRSLHEQGIIHRDISPDNICCMPDGIRLFDFGAAQVLGTQKAAQAVIKPGYTPPEQYQKNGQQGFYTDIYAIGASMYEMLTGIRPVEAVERIRNDGLKKPGELGIHMPENMEKAVMQAMAVEPAYRFENVEQLREALCGRRPAQFPEVRRQKKRRKRSLAAACIVLLLLLAVAGQILRLKISQTGLFDVSLKEDTICVWIPVEEEPNSGTLLLDAEAADDTELSAQLESYGDYEAQYRFYDTAKTIQMFLMDEEYPDNQNIKVALVPMPVQKYAEAFEHASENDADTDSRPTLFLTEGLSADSREHYADLEQLYRSLQLEDYYFLPDHESLFPDSREIPTGFDTLFLYWRKKSGGKNTQMQLNQDLEMADLYEDILTPAREDGRELADFVGWERERIVETLYLLDDSMADSRKVHLDEDLIADAQLMFKMQREVSSAHGNMEEWFDSAASDLAGIIADSTLLRSRVIAAAKGNYTVSLLGCNGRVLAVCRDLYAVHADADENEKNAAMRILTYMLTQKAQNLHYQQHRRALPLRRDAFLSYMDSESQFLRVLKQPVEAAGEDSMAVSGAEGQTLYRCSMDFIEHILENDGINADEIHAYLQEYE